MSKERKQIGVRLSPVLYRKVKIKAAQTGQTITQIVRQMLKEWVAEEQKE